MRKTILAVFVLAIAMVGFANAFYYKSGMLQNQIDGFVGTSAELDEALEASCKGFYYPDDAVDTYPLLNEYKVQYTYYYHMYSTYYGGDRFGCVMRYGPTPEATKNYGRSYQRVWGGTVTDGVYTLSGSMYNYYPMEIRFPDLVLVEEVVVCGDGVVGGEEICDEGVDNGVVPEAPYDGQATYCTLSCTEASVDGDFCGDSVVNGPEECDVEAGCDSSCNWEVVAPTCPAGYSLSEIACGCVHD